MYSSSKPATSHSPWKIPTRLRAQSAALSRTAAQSNTGAPGWQRQRMKGLQAITRPHAGLAVQSYTGTPGRQCQAFKQSLDRTPGWQCSRVPARLVGSATQSNTGAPGWQRQRMKGLQAITRPHAGLAVQSYAGTPGRQCQERKGEGPGEKPRQKHEADVYLVSGGPPRAPELPDAVWTSGDVDERYHRWETILGRGSRAGWTAENRRKEWSSARWAHARRSSPSNAERKVQVEDVRALADAAWESQGSESVRLTERDGKKNQLQKREARNAWMQTMGYDLMYPSQNLVVLLASLNDWK
ncbi:hypothetical protein FB45DRAFT_859300 [Roridomyces roridus]|uniref:Uncharacterized protein n=1 Tax=Roridomyces roridus TaxID=1738132 RepID=A0AAD7CJR0_9AGAR|nr:hypothetical protein FB45DRAFT_859300 [Roridomyces roridus]